MESEHEGKGGRGVSLTRPRPDASRLRNEYVETPLRGRQELHPAALHSVARTDNNNKNHLPGKVVRRQPAADCSILCTSCGRCRCDACRQPRAPPSAWLCSDACYCSVDSAVDYLSCLCCVKGAMYHCWEGGQEAADAGCGCGPPRPAARWACLGLAALPLPCLLCYWPLRSLASSSKRLYALCSPSGCSCPQSSLLPR